MVDNQGGREGLNHMVRRFAARVRRYFETTEDIRQIIIEGADRERVRSPQPKEPRPVVLITLPKSGSMYLYHTLQLSYDLKTFPHFGGEFPNVELNRNLVHELLVARGISQTHIAPSRHNLIVMNHFFDRAVVHVRDPRQALLSWVHSAELLMRDSVLDHQLFGFDASFFNAPLSERIDREVDRFYPHLIEWLHSWMTELRDRSRSCLYLLTSHEQMVGNPPAMAMKLAYFFNLPPRDLIFPDNKTSHFRVGKTDEWREAFTLSQQERVNALLTDELRKFYGWDQ
jgi:Sulfotransferase domain